MSENIKVVVRCRPMNQTEKERNCQVSVYFNLLHRLYIDITKRRLNFFAEHFWDFKYFVLLRVCNR